MAGSAHCLALYLYNSDIAALQTKVSLDFSTPSAISTTVSLVHSTFASIQTCFYSLFCYLFICFEVWMRWWEITSRPPVFNSAMTLSSCRVLFYYHLKWNTWCQTEYERNTKALHNCFLIMHNLLVEVPHTGGASEHSDWETFSKVTTKLFCFYVLNKNTVKGPILLKSQYLRNTEQRTFKLASLYIWSV